MKVILLLYLGFLLRLSYCDPPGPRKESLTLPVAIDDDEDVIFKDSEDAPSQGVADSSLAIKEASKKIRAEEEGKKKEEEMETEDPAALVTKQTVWDSFGRQSSSPEYPQSPEKKPPDPPPDPLSSSLNSTPAEILQRDESASKKAPATTIPANAPKNERQEDGKATPDGRPLENVMQHSGSQQSTVDITNPAASGCLVYNHDYDHVPSTTIIPSTNTKVTRLMSKEKVIWRAGRGERCMSCRLHFKRGKAVFVVLQKEAKKGVQTVIYRLRNGSWKKIESIDIEDFKMLMKRVRHRTDFVLDLASKSNKHCDVFKYPKGSGSATAYYPKTGHHATEIKYNSTLIWLSTGERTCTLCQLLDGEPKTLYLEIRDGKNLYTLIFEEGDSSWESITREHINARNKKEMYRTL